MSSFASVAAYSDTNEAKRVSWCLSGTYNTSDVEPEAAGHCLQVTFDKVFATKKGASLVPNVTDAIGQALENECMMRHYEAKVSGLHAIKSYFLGQRYPPKVKVITTLMHRYDVPHWQCWGRANRVKLAAGYGCICGSAAGSDRHAATGKQTYELRNPVTCLHGDQRAGHGLPSCSAHWLVC